MGSVYQGFAGRDLEVTVSQCRSEPAVAMALHRRTTSPCQEPPPGVFQRGRACSKVSTRAIGPHQKVSPPFHRDRGGTLSSHHKDTFWSLVGARMVASAIQGQNGPSWRDLRRRGDWSGFLMMYESYTVMRTAIDGSRGTFHPPKSPQSSRPNLTLAPLPQPNTRGFQHTEARLSPPKAQYMATGSVYHLPRLENTRGFRPAPMQPRPRGG